MEQVRWRHMHGVLESGVDAIIREVHFNINLFLSCLETEEGGRD